MAQAGDALHQSRIALRETFQVLQRSIAELQTDPWTAITARCWFQFFFFLCSSLIGEDVHFDEHIFQMG